MAMEFPHEVLLPHKTICRKGSVSQIARESLEFGMRGLIVHGHSLEEDGKREKIVDQFPPGATVESYCRGSGEPTLDEVAEAIEKAKAVKAEWVVGIGGGSVLDLAKASAGLVNAKEKAIYYQEGGELKERGVPFIAVPTTAGTGSETTPNAVITNKEKKTKLSIRDKSFLARTVILDVELLKGLPHSIMSCAAMDALVQGYESFISKNATWFSETFALKSIDLINKNILPACSARTEENLSALLIGSYYAGIGLAASRLGVIHGIAHPLGALYNIAHGLICSVCFTPSIKLNREVMGNKYDVMSSIVGMDFLERAEMLMEALRIISPFKGKTVIEKEKIITETLQSGSTAANPKQIDRTDVEFILAEVFAP